MPGQTVLASCNQLPCHLGVRAERCPTPLGQAGGEHSCWRRLQRHLAWPTWAGTLLSRHAWLLTAGSLVPPSSQLLIHMNLLGRGK